jgi:hypothetical protein
MVNDNLCLVRGMATLDAVKDRKIEKLRSIKRLPPEAARTIESSK